MKKYSQQTNTAARVHSPFGKPALCSAVIIASLALSACAGGKKSTANDVASGADNGKAVAAEDITRPPQTIVGREEVKEQNPEETISFDEWRKKRLEAQRNQ